MDFWRLAFRLGWRNLWRNPRRSLITASAIAAAYSLLIGLIGMMEGLTAQLLRNGTLLELGHLQIHDSSYIPDRNLYDTLGSREGIDVPRLLARLRRHPAIRAAAPRVRSYGLLSTGESSAGAQLLGIRPEDETQVTTLLRSLQSGSLERLQNKGLLLGDTLARELGAGLGDEVAVVAQAADGSLGNDLFHVAGILRTGLRHLDRSLAVAYVGDLQALLALPPERIHEIAVLISDAVSADSVAAELNRSGILPRDAVAQSWGDLSPQLRDYLNLAEGFNTFVIFLVALFAAFGVLNTMMMAVFERTREIGMLGSLGTTPLLILLSVLSESLCLAALGLAAGFGVGSLIMADMIHRGWDLSRWFGEMSMIDTRMDPVLRGAWSWEHVFWAGLGLVIATLLAAFLPARRASALNPVEALTAPTEG